MLAKSPCQHCQVNIEFDIEMAGQFVDCPSCHQKTRLIVPSTTPARIQFKDVKTKWGLSQWTMLGLVIILVGLVVFILLYPDLRNGSLMMVAVVAVGTLIVLLGYLLITSGILLQFIMWSMIAFGLYLAVDGFFLRQEVESNPDSGVLHQIYATIEVVGGALVFCAAMILHVLVKFTPSIAKTFQVKSEENK